MMEGDLEKARSMFSLLQFYAQKAIHSVGSGDTSESAIPQNPFIEDFSTQQNAAEATYANDLWRADSA